MKNYKWQLMSNNILLKDKNNLIQFIKKTNKFTNGPKVIEFEKKWSKWLGVKSVSYTYVTLAKTSRVEISVPPLA